MDKSLRRILEAEIRYETRPWSTLTSWMDREAVDLEFPLSESTEGEEIAQTAGRLGFTAQVDRVESLKKSLGNEAHELLRVVIHYGPTVYATYKGAKDLLDLPDVIRKFRDRIGPHLRRAERLAPPLQLPVVASWLAREYGDKKWRVDPAKVEAKSILGKCVFVVREELSGKTHLLAVDGDECEELQTTWQPETGSKSS